MFCYSPCEQCAHANIDYTPQTHDSPAEMELTCDLGMESEYSKEGCWEYYERNDIIQDDGRYEQ